MTETSEAKRLTTKFLVILLICISTFSYGQKTFSNQEFNSDVDYLVLQLRKYYPGLYRYESPEEFEARRVQLYRNGTDSISLEDSYKLLADFVSGIKDLHLGLGLPKKYFDKNTKSLPLILRKFDNRFYIHYNLSNDSTFFRTSEILSINGQMPKDDFERFKSFYGVDNENPVSKNYYAEKYFSNYYTAWYGEKDSAKIAFRLHPDSMLIEKNIGFINGKDGTKNLTKRYKNVIRKNLEVEILDSLTKTSKLDIFRFKGPKAFPGFSERKFKKKLKSSFKKINEDETENLILDLRANGGGAVVNVHRLLFYLSPKPFNIYDSISVSKKGFKKIFKPYLILPYLVGKSYLNKKDGDYFYRTFSNSKKKFKPVKKYAFTGNLYVIMDGGFYSATTFTISLLKNMNRATFVGTTPGGANWGSFAGQFYKVKLPNTKLQARIPLMTLVHNTENKNYDGFFVEPDYSLNQSFGDFEKRIDTSVEFIKNMIKNERN